MPFVQKDRSLAAYQQAHGGQLKISGGLSVPFMKTRFEVQPVPLKALRLTLSLRQNKQRLTRIHVAEGQSVTPGTLLANGGGTSLHCPVHGIVRHISPDKRKAPGWIEIEQQDAPPAVIDCPEPSAPPEQHRRFVRQMGIWDSIQHGMTMTPPPLDDEPAEIVVRCVFAEPGRIPGSMIIRKHLHDFIKGLKYLYQLSGSYAPIVMTVPVQAGALGKEIREQLRGQAFVHIATAPIHYPVENPLLLTTLLGRQRQLGPDHFWVVDPQVVIALCHAYEQGQFWSHRYVSVVGPAVRKPVVVQTPLGTGLRELVSGFLGPVELEHCALIRGGLFSGKRASPEEGLRFGDDTIWVIPETETPELLGWLRPGSDCHSWTRTVLSAVTGKKIFQARTLMRGATRPCIGCGFCPQVCPAGLYPQQLHRLITHDYREEAEQLGLLNCVECGCCSYGCVSKLELSKTIINARRTLLQNEANGL